MSHADYIVRQRETHAQLLLVDEEFKRVLKVHLANSDSGAPNIALD
jgi:hypothetical protein